MKRTIKKGKKVSKKGKSARKTKPKAGAKKSAKKAVKPLKKTAMRAAKPAKITTKKKSAKKAAKPIKKSTKPAEKTAKKAAKPKKSRKTAKPSKKVSRKPARVIKAAAAKLSASDLLSKIKSRISNLDGEEKRVLDQQVQLEAQKRRLFAEMVLAKKKQIRETEARLRKRQRDLDKKERVIKSTRLKMDSRVKEIGKKAAEIEKKLREEKGFHKTLGDYLKKQKEHHNAAVKVIESHTKQNLELQKIRQVLLAKERSLKQMEDKIMRQDKTVPLKKRIDSLMIQLKNRNAAFERFKKLSDGELNKLRMQVKEQTKKPKTVVKKVVDQAMLNAKLAEQEKVLEQKFLKIAQKKAGTLDPKVRMTLKELAAVVLKLPEKKLEPLFDSKNFPIVREVLQKYKIE